MAPMPSRLLVSLLVGLAVAAGTVAAGGTPAPGDGPTDRLVLPPVHDGDEGRYVSAGEELRFWFEQTEWLAPDGHRQRALLLTLESNETGRSRHWLEGSRVLATELDVGGGGSASWTSIGNDAVSTYAFGFYDVFETRYGPAAAPPRCGLLVLLGPHSLSSPGCGDYARRGTSLEFSRGNEGVLLDARLPVPVQLRGPDGALNLVAFHRGGAPADHGRRDGSLAVSFAQGSGPDETGIDHPFHLSSALLFAGLPPSPLAAFFQSHPDAYLAAAAFREVVEPGQRSLVWTLTASDGRDRIAVEARQVTAQAHDPPVNAPVGTGLVLPAPPVPVIVEVAAADRPYPAANGWSPRFATLASLEHRWAAAAEPESRIAGMNAYGFDVLCGADCTQARTETWIGVDRIRSRQEPRLPVCPTVSCDYQRWVWVVDRLAVRDDGLTAGRLHSEYVLSGREVAVGGGDWDGWLDEAAGPDRATTGASVWSVPSGSVAAGAGLLGLLSGLACYLWPQLKGALAGLWRAQPDHPTRERLALLVSSRPGIHFHELRRQSGLAAGTLRHHLQAMESAGTLTAHSSAGYKVYFPASGAARGLAAAAPALKAPGARRILSELVAKGGLTMGEAAAVAGMAPSTATYHVRRLHEAGLVTRQRRGKTIELLPTPTAGQALGVG